jgi:hypothetical protein
LILKPAEVYRREMKVDEECVSEFS